MITFQFIPLQVAHLPLLFQWLALPHVAAWWRETRDWEKFSAKYQGFIADPTIGGYIAYHNGKPIGYISWYDVAHDPHREEKFSDRTYGFDVFIADTDYIGKGYGVELIRQFIKDIIMPMNPTKIITDPEITNERAIRAYEKVGFKRTVRTTATDGTKMVTAQLMELDPLDIK